MRCNVTFNPDTDIEHVHLYCMWQKCITPWELFSAWLSTIGLCFDNMLRAGHPNNPSYVYRFDSAEDRLMFKLKYGI